MVCSGERLFVETKCQLDNGNAVGDFVEKMKAERKKLYYLRQLLARMPSIQAVR